MTEARAKIVQAVRQAEEEPPRNPLGDCPIWPLGHRHGRFYFLNKAGEVIAYQPRDLAQAGIDALFVGSVDWLVEQFPALDKEGNKTGNYLVNTVRRALMQACDQVGLFDPSTPMRGIGVWLSDSADGGKLICHCGASVGIDGQWRPAGFRLGRALYVAAPPIPRPAMQPATAIDGERVLQALRRWNYAWDIGPEILLGYIGQALLGAAPRWRAHLYTVGRRGCGKTELTNTLSEALGAAAHDVSNNFSEAGLRQSLSGEARALILDESEVDESGRGRVEFAIELLRHMSAHDGAKAVRGGTDGTAHRQQVVGACYLSSILHVPLKPQDRSRITVLQLLPLVGARENTGDYGLVLKDREELRRLSPGLRARALAKWPMFVRCHALYRAEVMRQGLDPRQADQIATLLSGRDMLLRDKEPDADAVMLLVERCHEVVTAAAEEAEEGEGQLCLTHLFTSVVDLQWRSGERSTVAQLLLRAVQQEGGEARRTIGALGLRLQKDTDGALFLLVANNHTALNRLFNETRWGRGVWAQALEDLAGAKKWHQPVRFAGVQSRCVGVPKIWLPREGDEYDEGWGSARKPSSDRDFELTDEV